MRMKNARLLFFLSFCLFFWQGAIAQNRPITGTISSDEGEALPNASVIVKGTTRGVLADQSGRFTISAATGETLVVSFIGYDSQEVPVTDASTYTIVLATAASSLDEVLLIGYGTQERAKVSGAVASVNMKELGDVPIYSVEQGLQGRVAGVSVQQVSGAPGAAFRVNVRGVGTVGDNEPLYVIDGYPVIVGTQGDFSTSPLARLNPADIESITVLKDASAAAIYGALAANGVVIIKTKRGATGKPKVSFNGYAGVQQVWRKLDLLGERDYAEFVNEKYANAGLPISEVPANLRDVNNLPGNNTDWQDELFRNAPVQDYNVDISGGTEAASYSVGAGYLNQVGTMLGTSFERYSFKVNSDFKLGKRIRVGESLLVAYSEKFVEQNLGGRRQIENMIKSPATIPVFDDSFLGGYGWAVTDDGQDAENPVAAAALLTSRNREYSALGSVYAEVDIATGLTFRANAGINFGIGESYSYTPAYEGVRRLLRFSNSNQAYNTGFSPLLETTLTYNKSFGKHNVLLLAGYSQQSFNFFGMSGRAEQFPNNEVRSLGFGLNPSLNSYDVDERLESILGRFSYDYDGKYLLNVNIRQDGSSKLVNNKRDFFPSFSLGWRLSKEEFMANVDVLSDAKLRFSYGQVGNIKTLGAYQTANVNAAANYNFNGLLNVGVAPGGLINPDLVWERGTTTNFGLDLGFLDDRLTLVADYYIRDTKNWILFVPASPSQGAGDIGGRFENTGLIRNSGIELGLGWRKLTGDFTYSLNANFATLNNEVVSLGNGQPIAGGGTFSLGNLTRTDEGQPVGSYFGWQVQSIFQNQAEIDAANALDGNATTPYQAGAAPGDIRFLDIAGPPDADGNPTGPDGQITADDRTYIGSPIPKFIYGGTVNVGYKGFDLSLNIQGMAGHSVWNALRTWTEDLSQNFNQGAAILDRWTPTNTDTDIPRAINGDPNNNKRNSDRFVESGNFTRVKNLTLGYQIPVQGASWISNARVYFTSNNFLTFTKYSGLDPEVGGDNATLGRGIDIGTYPQARTYVLGVQLGF